MSSGLRRPLGSLIILNTNWICKRQKRFGTEVLNNYSQYHSSSVREIRTCCTLMMSSSEPRCSASASAALAGTAEKGEPDVVVEDVKKKGIITLNRPRALNSLNLSMIRKIHPAIRQFETTNRQFIIIKATGGKAFCAGGDIRAVTDSAKAGTSLYKEFFKEEYQLNNLIGTLQLPYIALIDGITMGGGVGLSVHGMYRVATERTLFAMPETAIGLFPDVGGGYFLPRLGGKLGLYLALTGHRLKGGDVFKAGIATHMCSSDLLGALEQELISLDSQHPHEIEQILKKFHDLCPEIKKPFGLEPFIPDINKHFAASSVEGIIESLQGAGSDWASKTVQTLSKMSPTSLKISRKLLEMGESLDLQESLQIEYRLSQRCCEDHDFIEGVRAVLVDKDQNPKWKPDTLKKVDSDILEKYFSTLPPERELVL